MSTEAASVLEVFVSEQEFPRYDPAHGTPDPMVRRTATLRLRGYEARLEQTHYGHPGRFNPWEARGVDMRIQSHTAQMKELCDTIATLLT